MNGVPALSHRPFVPDNATLDEFTPRAVVMGALLGMLFGASSLYLVLKVGLTVSASIPVAVIAIALFRLASKAGVRDSTILENNIVQTAGSAGESIAFGLGVTMPAILILGFDLEIARVTLVAVLGALLGILMMIPLRRTLIVARHAELKYPEGTACAEVLKAAEISKSAQAGGGARADSGRAGVIFLGFAIGLVYKTVNIALKGWKDVPEKVFGEPLKGGSVGAGISPGLLGVGYIIGPGIAAIMWRGAASGRTDRDIPMKWVLVGCLAIIIAIMLSAPLHMNLLGALLILVFGFLFSTVSSQLTGEIGSSSNPISGMTVATLLLTCLIFLALGMTNSEDRLTALSVAGVVCVAASNGGTTSQDLKTGYLVGATPYWQQIAITVGALSSALVIGWILVGLNQASTVYTAKNLPTLKQSLDVSALPQMEKAPGDDTLFHVWQAKEGNSQ